MKRTYRPRARGNREINQMANETNPDATGGLPDDVAAAWADVVIDVYEKRQPKPKPAEANAPSAPRPET